MLAVLGPFDAGTTVEGAAVVGVVRHLRALPAPLPTLTDVATVRVGSLLLVLESTILSVPIALKSLEANLGLARGGGGSCCEPKAAIVIVVVACDRAEAAVVAVAAGPSVC